ncbi:hypothetical protein MHYP_G00318870 [Metynnis hypsauchen]
MTAFRCLETPSLDRRSRAVVWTVAVLGGGQQGPVPPQKRQRSNTAPKSHKDQKTLAPKGLTLPQHKTKQARNSSLLNFKMKRKMDITSYFCTKKMNNNEADIETEPDGVKRAEEKQVESTTESEQEDLGDTGFQREGTEQ